MKCKEHIFKIFTCMIVIMFTFMGCKDLRGEDKNKNSKWIQDIDFLAKTLPKQHKNLFFKIKKEEFDKEINDLKKAVPNMNDDEIKVSIYKIIASVGDTHTASYPNPLKIYPMSLYWFKDGIYVNNTTNDYKNILYCKLVKVDNKDIGDIEKLLEGIIPHENEAGIKSYVPQYLSIPEILHGLKIVSDLDKVKLTFEDKKKHRFDVEMESVVLDRNFKSGFINKYHGSEDALYLQNSDKNYWYKYLDKKNTLYFKYNACKNDDDKPFEVFNKEIFGFINTHNIDKIVIDLRHNGGGNSLILQPFIDEMQKSKLNSKGKLFVIVGRATFSSAMLNVMDLKNKTNAIFVGEPTSGKFNHFGETKKFNLPNSNIEVWYSTKQFINSEDDSNSFIPDKSAEVSIDDYVHKQDPVLNSIIK